MTDDKWGGPSFWQPLRSHNLSFVIRHLSLDPTGLLSYDEL